MTNKRPNPVSATAGLATAASLVDLLTNDVGPAITAMLDKVQAAERAFYNDRTLRDRFNTDAEDGWGSLRHYLEHAAAEVKRIVKAKR